MTLYCNQANVAINYHFICMLLFVSVANVFPGDISGILARHISSTYLLKIIHVAVVADWTSNNWLA